MRPYRQACSYAYTLNRFWYKDYVHTAWLNHFKRTGMDLFKESIPYILTAVKFVHKRFQQDLFFQWRKESYRRVYYDVDGDHFFSELVNYMTPDKMAESNDEVSRFREKVDSYHSGCNSTIQTEILRRFLELKEQGYKHNEIADEMGISRQLTSYYSKRVKEIYGDTTNSR